MKRVLLLALLLFLLAAGVRNGNFEQGFRGWEARGAWSFVYHPEADGVHAVGLQSGRGELCAQLVDSGSALTFLYRGAGSVRIDGFRYVLKSEADWQRGWVPLATSARAKQVCFVGHSGFALDDVEVRQ